MISICSFRVSYYSIMYHQFGFDRKAPRLLLEVLCAIHLISASLSFIHLKQVIRPVLEGFIHQRSTGNWWLRIQTAFKNHHLASNARLKHIDINNLRVLLIYHRLSPLFTPTFLNFPPTLPPFWWFCLFRHFSASPPSPPGVDQRALQPWKLPRHLPFVAHQLGIMDSWGSTLRSNKPLLRKGIFTTHIRRPPTCFCI